MLPKSSRLDRKQVLVAIKDGKTINSPSCSYKYIQTNTSAARFAVVVSTKISKRAVVRNHLRRQIYSLVAVSLKGVDVVIFPKKQMLELNYEQIGADVNSHLSKIL